MSGKKVLLARPHAFIVSEMLPFLDEAGYVPQKLEKLSDVPTLPASAFAGVVISTAVISSINASAEEVFNAIRARLPRVPILFAGLTEFTSAHSAVERIVRTQHPDAGIFPVAAVGPGASRLGSASAFLVLGKRDLENAPARAAALTAVRTHFR